MKIKFILFAILIGLFIFPNFVNAQTNYWFPSGVQLKPVLNTWGINLSGTSTLSTTTISNLIITGTCTGCGGGDGGLATSSPFTAGYIPYATSTNSLVNSNIFQLAGGFVGIGTSTPEYALDVWGNSRFTGNILPLGTKVYDLGGTSNYWNIVYGDTLKLASAATIANTSGNNILFTAGNPSLQLLSSGNAEFSVSVTANNDSSINLGSTIKYWLETFTDTLTLNSTAYLSGATAGIIAGTGQFTLNDNFRIDASGNVATGTWQGTAIADAYVADDITLTNITQITNRNLSNLQGTLSIASTTGLLTYDRGGTGTSTALALQNLWWGNGSGGLVQVASSTLGGGGTAYDKQWITSGTALYSSSTFTSIGIGTTTPSSIFQVYGTTTLKALIVNNNTPSATATISIGIGAPSTSTACIKMMDSDSLGWTYLTSLNGVLTATTSSCE